MRKLVLLISSIVMMSCLYSATNMVYEIVTADVPTYLNSLDSLANAGNADALFELGYYNYKGYKFDSMYGRGYSYNFSDRKKAVEYFKLSSHENNTNAQYYLGLCYLDAIGVVQNNEEAIRLVKLAAENGNQDAQYTMGTWLKSGTVLKPDRKKAYEWFRLSAVQGNPLSQYELSQSLLTSKKKADIIEYQRWTSLSGGSIGVGHGINYDPIFTICNVRSQAKNYLEQAQKGNSPAQFNIGKAYEYGNGVEQSYAQAFYWYSVSANQGNVEAQNRLSRSYALGIGTPISFKDAYYWKLIAAATGGGTETLGYAIDLEYYLSSSDKKEIRESASAWFESH